MGTKPGGCSSLISTTYGLLVDEDRLMASNLSLRASIAS